MAHGGLRRKAQLREFCDTVSKIGIGTGAQSRQFPPSTGFGLKSSKLPFFSSLNLYSINLGMGGVGIDSYHVVAFDTLTYS